METSLGLDLKQRNTKTCLSQELHSDMNESHYAEALNESHLIEVPGVKATDSLRRADSTNIVFHFDFILCSIVTLNG